VKGENMKRKKIFIGIAACVVIFIIGLYASQHYVLKNKLFSSYDIDITKNESMGNDIMTVSKSD
jgi:hypothetical protein